MTGKANARKSIPKSRHFYRKKLKLNNKTKNNKDSIFWIESKPSKHDSDDLTKKSSKHPTIKSESMQKANKLPQV